MSSIALEPVVDEPLEGVQDQLLILKTWEEHKAKLAIIANDAHQRARRKLKAATRALRLHPCSDEEL